VHSCARVVTWLLQSTRCHLRHLQRPRQRRQREPARPAPLAIFSHAIHVHRQQQMGRARTLVPLALLSIAAAMTHAAIGTLQRTAISTNIKERLDFSCALFDAQGGLVANAPSHPRAPGQHARRSSFPSSSLNGARLSHQVQCNTRKCVTLNYTNVPTAPASIRRRAAVQSPSGCRHSPA